MADDDFIELELPIGTEVISPTFSKPITYTILERLGRGMTCVCYRARQGNDDTAYVALKIMKLSKESLKEGSNPFPKEIRKEIALLYSLSQCKGIVKPVDFWASEKHICIAMEYCEGGSMFEFIRERENLYGVCTIGFERCRIYLHQLLRVLCLLHKNDIVHCDIKPGNIFFSTKELDQIQLGDFGLARRLKSKTTLLTEMVGTPQYVAPEILVGKERFGVEGYSCPADIWSAGIILYLLVYGSFPYPFETQRKLRKFLLRIQTDEISFPATRNRASMNPITKQLSHEEEKVPQILRHLLKGMLQIDPGLRFTADQAYKHAFFLGTSSKSPFNKNLSPKSTPSSSSSTLV